MYTLQQTINWAKPFVEYNPLTAGIANEPAITIASIVRHTLLNPPLTWSWNRKEYTGLTIDGTNQDYTVALADFGFLEKVTLVDSKGNVYELKDLFNTIVLSKANPNAKQRPQAVSVLYYTPGVTVTFRFMGYPDQQYSVNLIYQKYSPLFGPFSVTSVQAAIGASTTYLGIFDPLSFPVGSNVTIVGCTNSANNGTFPLVSCSTTLLVVQNSVGVLETAPSTAAAENFSWSPIPDSYNDIYNNLFLAEALSVVNDDTDAARYRQRGVAAFLNKAEGLSETQKNSFVQQWMARGVEAGAVTLRLQQSAQARAI